MLTDPYAIEEALAACFDPKDVKWKPQSVSGNRALAVPFVDVRVVQDRLDEVLGVLGWQDTYVVCDGGSVVCRLSVRSGQEWITKEDVGSPSEQPDAGDRLKASFSDALKRAAVKVGVGRYLYKMKPQWVDYDPQKRQFVRTPKIPDEFLPVAKTKVRDRAPSPSKPAAQQQQQQQPQAANGAASLKPSELYLRVLAYEGRLIEDGLCAKDALVDHLVQTLGKVIPGHVSVWDDQYSLSVEKACKDFAASCRQDQEKKAAAASARN